eukprot:TRINITY_DN8727_c0_g1_i1.p1 TRINITY_DN8727_c0_g1~~TRINITY_DN8727_c0_g1_i1.p1  ORF type:complete len:120 (-),score=16.02 TRINITY_DN8727_c0_g1_i1:26-385(-)
MPKSQRLSSAKKGCTPFQQRVYDLVSKVPKGSVTTYKIVADQLGCKSSQAVGQALRCNPYAPVVPCHRVVCSDRRLGGFFGQTDDVTILRKRDILKDEGVKINASTGAIDNDVTFFVFA